MNAKRKLVEAALELLLERGYPSTTVDEICAAAGVSKGSFYHFFRAKEDLGVAVLEAYAERGAKRLFSGAFVDLKDPVERLLGFLEHVESISDELWGNGCLLGSFAVDLAETHPRIREQVSGVFREVSQAVATLFGPLSAQLARGGEDVPPEELAEQFLSVLEGAIILATAHGDPSRISKGLKGFRRYVERLAKT